MLFLKKKNESIVCVGNWAQALHFIEQQISTCTVVATSVPSSLSPGLSVPRPILSLAYPCGKKSPLLVISRATKAQTVVFFFLPVQPPSGWNSPRIPKPSGRQHLHCSKACLGERLGACIMFCPSHFYFFGERRKYVCDDTGLGAWSASVPWGVHPTLLSGWEQVTGLSFSLPHSLL